MIDGLYMFYCYNLIYEDYEMMVVFNVIVLKDLGYDFFVDFMVKEWRVVKVDVVDYMIVVIMVKVKKFVV